MFSRHCACLVYRPVLCLSVSGEKNIVGSFFNLLFFCALLRFALFVMSLCCVARLIVRLVVFVLLPALFASSRISSCCIVPHVVPLRVACLLACLLAFLCLCRFVFRAVRCCACHIGYEVMRFFEINLIFLLISCLSWCILLIEWGIEWKLPPRLFICRGVLSFLSLWRLLRSLVLRFCFLIGNAGLRFPGRFSCFSLRLWSGKPLVPRPVLLCLCYRFVC